LFLQEVLPDGGKDLDFRTEFFLTVVASVAEEVSSRNHEPERLHKWALALSTMLCKYFKIL